MTLDSFQWNVSHSQVWPLKAFRQLLHALAPLSEWLEAAGGKPQGITEPQDNRSLGLQMTGPRTAALLASTPPGTVIRARETTLTVLNQHNFGVYLLLRPSLP